MYREFLEHLELREGNEECVYLDTLGKPTCGVGHLLTERERQVYKVGDKVSKEQRDAWLDQDAAQAWEAAPKSPAALAAICADLRQASARALRAALRCRALLQGGHPQEVARV